MNDFDDPQAGTPTGMCSGQRLDLLDFEESLNSARQALLYVRYGDIHGFNLQCEALKRNEIARLNRKAGVMESWPDSPEYHRRFAALQHRQRDLVRQLDAWVELSRKSLDWRLRAEAFREPQRKGGR